MSRVFVYPYKSGSKSAALLAKELAVSRLKLVGSKIADNEDLIIINWGSSSIPYRRAKVLNTGAAVNTAANKLNFFKKMAASGEVNIPRFTTEYTTAVDWIKDGFNVCSRAVLDGNEGRGLLITDKVADLPKGSPLYTRYFPKSAEFRVYIVNGHPVRAQRKVYPSAKIAAGDKPDWKIRNEANGFLFVVAELKDIPSSAIFSQAALACKHCGLDFGGVDIAWNATKKEASVLEVNTAPGIEGMTATIVANHLRTYIESLDK